MFRRSTIALFVLALLAGLPAAAHAGAGALRPLSANGCITANPTPPSACVRGRAMEEYYPEIAVSPDGRNVYAVSNPTSAVTTFDRDAAGGLTQKPAGAGCLHDAQESPAPLECTAVFGAGLLGAHGIAISPDGKNVYVVGSEESAINVFGRDQTSGVLTFKSCISLSAGTGCPTGLALKTAQEVTVSPDGNSVYTAAVGGGTDGSIGVFTRNPANGALTQVPSACLTGAATAGCTQDAAIRFPREVLVSPDNAHVYVADGGSEAVIAYNRAPNGALSAVDRATSGGCLAATSAYGNCSAYAPLSGSPENLAFSTDAAKLYVTTYTGGELHTLQRGAGGGLAPIAGACITGTATEQCPGTSANFERAYGIAVVPGNVYVASDNGGGVLAFDVGADGLPVPKELPFGCVHAKLAACTPVPGMTGMVDVAASPDGRHVYSYGFQTLIGMARDARPSCAPAGATVEAGSIVTVQLDCSDPEDDALAYEIVAGPAAGVLGSPDGAGRAAYAAPADAGGRSITFTYRAMAFGAVSDVATATISVTVPPAPTPGPGPVLSVPRITSAITGRWRAGARVSGLRRLTATAVPAGATVTITCSARGLGRKCPFKRLRRRATQQGTFNALRMISKRRRSFPVGARLVIRITAPGHVGQAKTFTMRKRRKPSAWTGCIPVGSSRILRTCP